MKKLTNQSYFILGIVYLLFTSFIWYQFVKESKAYFAPILSEKPNTVQIKIIEPIKLIEPTIREWVKNEVESAGLNFEIVDCIIENESGWNNWRYNINTNGSTDMGLWQINSIHKDTCSVECRWDYKCATHWAIQKRLNDGDWNAWYGFKQCR